ncbi:hypothetical protein SDC9_176487 [bioreactor metagenome]|uniref:Uncharacterized protein n=1 Tax=bioreactor metagenome TaxID=1076179 RepID=A0A645GTA4_9ZZZZ
MQICRQSRIMERRKGNQADPPVLKQAEILLVHKAESLIPGKSDPDFFSSACLPIPAACLFFLHLYLWRSLCKAKHPVDLQRLFQRPADPKQPLFKSIYFMRHLQSQMPALKFAVFKDRHIPQDFYPRFFFYHLFHPPIHHRGQAV